MEIFIRPATIADAPAIATLSHQLGYAATTNDIERRINLLLGHQDNGVFVALTGQKTVGWIHCFFTVRVESDPFVEIGGLVIDEGHRRNKIGKYLVEKTMEWAAEKGNLKLRVRCNRKRTESHQFYLSIGFVEIKEQKIFEMLAS